MSSRPGANGCQTNSVQVDKRPRPLEYHDVGLPHFLRSSRRGPVSVVRIFAENLMPITTPQQLVDEYKRSGAFDLLRKKLLTEFQNTVNMHQKSHEKFLERVDDIARDKLKDDVHLAYKKRDKLHEETMIELERYVFQVKFPWRLLTIYRYPLWERALNDAKSEILERRPFYLAVDEDLSRILQTEKLNMQARGVPIIWRRRFWFGFKTKYTSASGSYGTSTAASASTIWDTSPSTSAPDCSTSSAPVSFLGLPRYALSRLPGCSYGRIWDV
ncbi:COMPASS-Shg1 domain-containing protein [Rhizoctonia solani AG-1 IA]|uniref:COMPASS-Shg1 domain-containing protein n=1 Tax=Thanatephorus cucumeris (strain AG1-IA) TaxID=983506 RepID=L8WNM1_THACA|nr:COMPASS-Shg1 domain-containing protein [Rhizoctonia solani AG-1 IA]